MNKDKKELSQAETDKLFDDLHERGQYTELPPTPGFRKLGLPAQAAARSRAKAFYPFD